MTPTRFAEWAERPRVRPKWRKEKRFLESISIALIIAGLAGMLLTIVFESAIPKTLAGGFLELLSKIVFFAGLVMRTARNVPPNEVLALAEGVEYPWIVARVSVTTAGTFNGADVGVLVLEPTGLRFRGLRTNFFLGSDVVRAAFERGRSAVRLPILVEPFSQWIEIGFFDKSYGEPTGPNHGKLKAWMSTLPEVGVSDSLLPPPTLQPEIRFGHRVGPYLGRAALLLGGIAFLTSLLYMVYGGNWVGDFAVMGGAMGIAFSVLAMVVGAACSQHFAAQRRLMSIVQRTTARA